MKHDHATEVNMLKSQMQSMECEMKTKMKDLECDHEQQMAQLKNDLTLGDVTLRSNVEELEASLEVTSNKVASMKAQHSSKVQQLIQEKKAEVHAEREVHAKQTESIQTRHNRQVASMKHVAEKNRQKMDQAIEDLRVMRNDEMKELIVSHDSYLRSKSMELQEVKRQIFADKKAANAVSFWFVSAVKIALVKLMSLMFLYALAFLPP